MFMRLYLHLQFSFQELVVKRVKTALARNAGRASTAPTDHVVKLWQSNYNSFKVDIDRALSDNNNGVDDDIIFRVFNWEEYKDQPAVTEAALSWAREAKKNLNFFCFFWGIFFIPKFLLKFSLHLVLSTGGFY